MSVYVHASQQESIDRYLERGYIEVRRTASDRVELADPKTTCLLPLRGGGRCGLDFDHRGRHGSVVYHCDVCGKARRGSPHLSGPEGIAVCFLCANESYRRRGFVIDFLATSDSYRQHLAPIEHELWKRGVLDVARSDGLVPLPDDGTPTVIAGHSDLALVPGSRPVCLVDHGAGQTYQGVDHGAFNGGRDRERISLFLYGSARARAINEARWPDAAHVVTGPASLDGLVQRQQYERDTIWHTPTPTVVLTWHWESTITHETRSALPWYDAVLPRLAERPWRTIGHAHPKAWEQVEWRYASTSIEVEHDYRIALRKADVLVADNTSALYEAAALGIPTLALDAPWYREDPGHGLRFYDLVPGLRLRAYREQAPTCGVVHPAFGRDALVDAITEALEDRAELRAQRAAVTEAVYGALDGCAARRAADAIEEWSRAR